jgi:hypothetical protein
LKALQRDVGFLTRHGLMDYSLLVAEETQNSLSMQRFGSDAELRSSPLTSSTTTTRESSIISVISLDPTER